MVSPSVHFNLSVGGEAASDGEPVVLLLHISAVSPFSPLRESPFSGLARVSSR